MSIKNQVEKIEEEFDAICEYCGINFGEMKDNAIVLSLHIRDNHEVGRGKLKNKF